MAERKLSEVGPSKIVIPVASFPTHNSPRIWFMTSALSPLVVRLIKLLLAHGDYVAAGLPPSEMEDDDRSAEFRELINECKSGRKDREAVVGTVEELSVCSATQNLVRDQFETIFFGQVNFIKATLPLLRERHNGHIMILTGITGHIGTPGMSMYSAATWALEGYCDSLAYEIAPFNIKLTIVQPNKEIQVLINKIIFAPQLPQYESHNNPAPGLRDILTNVVNLHPETRINTDTATDKGKGPGHSGKGEIVSRFPRLPSEARDSLVLETVHALTAIGGHENPPARHIVGHEGVLSVKEKLKTVSEELEDFVEVSCAVDIFKSDVGRAALSGGNKTDASATPASAGGNTAASWF
ncbi:NAD(P)-binding Rossmann-fold containing protein [Venustampulla echinocandica]|uniref:NAD(P)-binding Rossmann-fold containing protein n=1 Tax=Venustampulla echinocandica TaxID=2656787 RepID=A0A370TIV8_9HELO|nr:NAD(P)-binding Rossmann-fold containing protein [Venustampulla echinocandica]RDL35286.1 NAD(P)-binding Rossmann-fold containing protein [Venustampulla echinocandica]